jgi:hypothetical protein
VLLFNIRTAGSWELVLQRTNWNYYLCETNEIMKCRVVGLANKNLMVDIVEERSLGHLRTRCPHESVKCQILFDSNLEFLQPKKHCSQDPTRSRGLKW